MKGANEMAYPKSTSYFCMKILNLYANIGGNRKLWGDEHEITAVEIDPKIAAIYQDFWPNDTVVVADAHQYLLDHYEEFDFIWSSPPCPTHSRMNRTWKPKKTGEVNSRNRRMSYPDMALYQEVLFLQHYFLGKWCVENVIAFYSPLIPPQERGQHWFWANFYIPPWENGARGISNKLRETEFLAERMGFDLSKYKGIDKRLALRDCTEPELGAHILHFATDPYKLNLELSI